MRRALAAILTVGCALGIVAVREDTMSRHSAAPPGSATRVVFVAETNGAANALAQRAGALAQLCVLEVHGDIVGDAVERHGSGRFAFAVSPALDSADRRQLTGCLEDARIDRLQGDVVALRRRAAPSTRGQRRLTRRRRPRRRTWSSLPSWWPAPAPLFHEFAAG